MAIKIALVGNPNCGKTTLFNALTGSNQYVGNWPGVTVEKKEGKVKWNKDVIVTDLPGIYSLSPYSPEEVVARNYLVNESPDVILNILDGSNIERNLYLTTQLAELGIPMLVAVNMMDVVKKSGDEIYLNKLSSALGCKVVGISAVKEQGVKEACEKAIELSASHKEVKRNIFSKQVEEVLAKIEDEALADVDANKKRWYAIKVFEKDKTMPVDMSPEVADKVNGYISQLEDKLEDDSEGIITNERYEYITSLNIKKKKEKAHEKSTISDKIDKVVTNRWLALPIFAIVMFLVYYIAMAPGFIGDALTGWANDGVFGDGYFLFGVGEEAYNQAVEDFENGLIANEPNPADGFGAWIPGIPALLGQLLEAIHSPAWLTSLVLDGIIGGVGAVLGFVPQMLLLFLMLSLLEDCGYMARVAFIMDRVFRRFGLSGKSFIPMLVATGCGVPGIMASRTIENERDRRMTIMTTGFIPCGAKMPIVGLIAGAVFGGNAFIAVAAYFIGVAAVIVSGIILKKTKAFAGEPAPFVMELPAYHAPVAGNVGRATWERGWSFIKRAGTVIFVSAVLIWVLNSLSWASVNHEHEIIDPETDTIVEVQEHDHKGIYYIDENCESDSILKVLGSSIAPVFKPLGFSVNEAEGGDWKAAVATILGLVAKEEVVGTFGTLTGMDADEAMGMAEENDTSLSAIGQAIFAGNKLAAFSFLIFNLLCAPCFAAIGAIKREMNSTKWTWAAIGFMTGLAYAASLMVWNIGNMFYGIFNGWTVVALILLVLMCYWLFKPAKFTLVGLFAKATQKKTKA
ncbi:MAG: ferrous iron transport protein B [Clostridia bacterium]|nr:ferrous iron transport protein B [Clostridia bacterium]